MKPEIIVSLDTMTNGVFDYVKAWNIIKELGDDQEWYKIGLRTVYSHNGISFVDYLVRRNKKIMLDAKLYDIESTIRDTVGILTKTVKPEFLTVANNIEAALEKETSKTKIVQVFELTDSVVPSQHKYAEKYITASAFVCPPELVESYRELYPNKIIITPGVRLTDHSDEHKGSTAIPKNADYIVVGRPIINPENGSYKKTLELFKEAVANL